MSKAVLRNTSKFGCSMIMESDIGTCKNGENVIST